MSYAIYSFNVQTKKGKQKYSIEASPDDGLGEVFVDIVKGSQSTDFPISVKRSDGSDIEWRFHIVDQTDEIQEVFPDQTLRTNAIKGEQLIYAYDDSDIGARSPILIQRSKKKDSEDGDEEGAALSNEAPATGSHTDALLAAVAAEEDGYAPTENLGTLEMDSSWMNEMMSGGTAADVAAFNDADTAAPAPATPSADPAVAFPGGPKFPHAVQHHFAILQEVLANNQDILTTTYDWGLLDYWGYGWNEIPIHIHQIQGMTGMFEDDPLLTDEHSIKIHIPTSFPDSRPKVIPTTPMWHPNIRPESETEEGDICWIGQWTGDELYRCLERLLANVIEILQYAKVRGGDHARMNEAARDWLMRKFGSLTGYSVPHTLRMLRRAEANGPAIVLS